MIDVDISEQFTQLDGDLFLTNGGLETTFIYHEKKKLPYFASFHILKDDSGYEWMKNYLRQFVNIAEKSKLGFILEAPTWRAHHDWIIVSIEFIFHF